MIVVFKLLFYWKSIISSCFLTEVCFYHLLWKIEACPLPIMTGAIILDHEKEDDFWRSQSDFFRQSTNTRIQRVYLRKQEKPHFSGLDV